ncbi:MAG: hypothetical protein ACLTSX_14200 [Collinsella sp.]
MDFDDEIVVSSTEGFNVEAFVDVVAGYLPARPAPVPRGQLGTDEADEVMVSRVRAREGAAAARARRSRMPSA